MSSSSLPAAVWFFLAAACGVAYLIITKPTFEPEPGVGAKLENFAVVTLGDPLQIVPLSAVKEPVVLINFWGTWCGPCRIELPELADLAKKFANEPRFRLLPISCGSGGNDDLGEIREETKAYLAQERIDLTSYADPALTARASVIAAKKNDDFGFPTTVLIDRHRKIRAIWNGYSPTVTKEMEREIRALLAE